MSEQFEYDVFLSHNKADKPRVRKLAEWMKQAGLRVWFDEWVIQPGDDVYLAIEHGLEASRTLVLCLSPAALGSDWVMLERSTALFRDPSNAGRRFIPLLLADCKLPDTLRRYRYIDYRDETQDAFAQVLVGCQPQQRVKRIRVPSLPPHGGPMESVADEEGRWQQVDERLQKNLPSGVRLLRTLRGHTHIVGRIAWSADGRTLASPSKDKTIRLWDAETGKCLHTLSGHKSGVYSVAFDSVGHNLASGCRDSTIRLWEPASGKLLRTLEGHQTSVYSVAFDRAARVLASGSNDRTIKLWDAASARLVRTLEGHQHSVISVAFNPTRQVLASGSRDATVKIWRPGEGQLIGTLKGHQKGVNTVAFDPAGKVLASGSEDATVMLWEVDTGRLMRTLEGHTESVRSVCFSPDGRLLASKGADDCVRIWRSDTGDAISIIPVRVSRDWSPGLAFHPSMPVLATVGSDPSTPKDRRDQVIHIWELDLDVLLSQAVELSAHYINAKVVLVGDTGVGKTGLSR